LKQSYRLYSDSSERWLRGKFFQTFILIEIEKNLNNKLSSLRINNLQSKTSISFQILPKLLLILLITLSASVFADDKIYWSGPFMDVDAGYSWTQNFNTEFYAAGGGNNYPVTHLNT